MRHVLLSLLLLCAAAHANEEITVELPRGATMQMVWIEPGAFLMGSPDSEPGRDWTEQQHEVTITRGFYLGKYEVTQAQWEAVTWTPPHRLPWRRRSQVVSGPDRPAVWVSWGEVQGFLGWLNETAGEDVYRLPTEAEWEYACRAGTTTRWSFGDDEGQLDDYAWWQGNTWGGASPYAQPVGTKLPNPWGLHDMHGNVWEYCRDWTGRYVEGSLTDPQGPESGKGHVRRGGSFDKRPSRVRSAQRYFGSPVSFHYSVGARVLREGPRGAAAVKPNTWGHVKAARSRAGSPTPGVDGKPMP